MREFIEYLVKQIVNNPQEVQVTEAKEEELSVYTINVAAEDMGTVIGKEGHNIKSIRNMAKAKAIKDNVHIRVLLHDDKETASN
jgi:predicted RNA-binding protein YlqC (UPF0109 family)